MSEELTRIGRYEILERVGRGSMGVLYHGRDTILDREVAVKVMNVDYAADSDARARFFREARAAAKLQHRNIVTVFEFSEHEGIPYIVMEFLRGESLASRLASGAPLEPLESIDIATQLSEGLEFAHSQQVVHRDVKPANIWLSTDGLVKLLDFGIAKYGTGGSTTARGLMGSPAYMSPEQIAGEEPDGRSDIFSLGVVLYELLCGRKPFDGSSPTEVMLKIVTEPPAPPGDQQSVVPQAIWDIVTRSLEKDPGDRFESAAAFGAALERASAAMRAAAVDTVEDLEVADTVFRPAEKLPPAPPHPAPFAPAPPPPAAKPQRPIGWRIGGGAAAAIALVALLSWGVTSMLTSGDPATPGNEAVPGSSTGTGGTTPPAGGGDNPAPAPPPALRTIEVTSDPPGAAIVIDGRRAVERTPGTISFPADKPLPRLVLSLAGYQSVDHQLGAQDVEAGTLSLKLPRLSQGTLEVLGDYPFTIAVGGRALGAATAQHSVTVPAGRHTVQLRAREVYLDQTLRAEILQNRTTTLRAPALARLEIRAPQLESCVVLVDDREDGNPPIAIRIVEGAHTVRLRCPDGRTTTPAGESLVRRVQVAANLPPQVFR